MSKKLTDRERQVAQLLAQGLTNTQIAARLSVSPGTVKHHVTVIFNKTGLRSRTLIAINISKILRGAL